MLNIKVN